MKLLAMVALTVTLGGCDSGEFARTMQADRNGTLTTGTSAADDKMLQELAAYQAAKETPQADIRRVEIERMTFGQGVTVIHDDKRNVTCWVYRTEMGGNHITGGGISCTPDWMLAPQKVRP